MKSDFIHLHLHSDYSLLDGACKISALMERAQQLGMDALAITDHGNLFGAVEFHDAALEAGIRPVIGCEVYVARDGHQSRGGRSDNSNHLVLLAQDAAGYHNLVKLVSFGFVEGFYYKPRIDKELLARHSQGLIGLSACLKGSVASYLLQDESEKAAAEAGLLQEILGRENFFLELQDHGLEAQHKVNAGLLELSRQLDAPLVATNDCHYITREDSFAHDVLLCIQTGKTVSDTNRMRYAAEQFYLKSYQEMLPSFRDVRQALLQTREIAERCNFRLEKGRPLLPHFAVPSGYTVESYFEEVVRKGFQERLPQWQQLERQGKLRNSISAYEERLEREIQIIKQTQFPSYFLIVWDFIRFAREREIPVGPGRGSAAGSLVSYCLRITDLDPLQYDLLFERFINPERVTPPDIDIDFCMNRRGEVIEYVTQKYGRANVSQIITFGTMAARGVIRDAGRGLNIPYAEVDRIAKLVPTALDTTLTKALSSVSELRQMQSDARYRQLIEVAQRLEGLARHASTHAAGVVIAPTPLTDYVPLYRSNKDEIMTQYSMIDLEKLGLLKMDFLALTTLTVLQDAVQRIQEELGVTVDWNGLRLEDPETFRLFCDGRTSCVFQFESGGMRDILRRLRPDRFEDLIALNALYRPGPIQGGMIDEYIKRRHGKIEVKYELPQLEEILKETYGVIVYQEQVMQVASKLAGFSLGEADLLRRAMGKKKADVMQAQRDKFITGAVANGINEKKAVRIFDLMEQFASYGFNKSHSAAYALIAYQTAYLKVHYPVQFMAAMLTCEMDKSDKMVRHLLECKEMGIEVLPPDINSSELRFRSDRGRILFGLAGIKNVGETAIQSILASRRQSGKFTSLFDFCERVDLRTVNKRVIESLIKAGAFDCLDCGRARMFLSIDSAMERAQKRQRDRDSGQTSLFETLQQPGAASPRGDLAETEEWGEAERLAFEKETLGFYLTGHPLSKYHAEIRYFATAAVGDLREEMSGKELILGGIITSLRKMQTRKGDTMAVLQVEDLTGAVEVIAFPQVYEHSATLLMSDSPVLVRGRCEFDENTGSRLLASEIVSLKTVWERAVASLKVRIPLERVDSGFINQLKETLTRFPGDCDLQFELLQYSDYRLILLPLQVRVRPSAEILKTLEEICGPESVSVVARG
ncbi:MAG: DNA polymerase III subunit alpha [Acidobacteria bacterium]|nr:DNA polymerase III subunit alpha [Acidobacteriota bacterium]